MHFHLTGKPETEKSVVGIYFADKAPERIMTTVGLPELFGFGAGIDIPPGEKNFTIQDSLTLPVDVKVYGAIAHAHYLAKDIKATATLPDGSTKPLIWIQDWDFNWQETYTYKEPFFAQGHADRRQRHLRQLRRQSAQSQQSAQARTVRRRIFRRDGYGGLNLVTVNPSDEPVLQKALAERVQGAIRRGGADGTAKRYLEHQAARRPTIGRASQRDHSGRSPGEGGSHRGRTGFV